ELARVPCLPPRSNDRTRASSATSHRVRRPEPPLTRRAASAMRCRASGPVRAHGTSEKGTRMVACRSLLGLALVLTATPPLRPGPAHGRAPRAVGRHLPAGRGGQDGRLLALQPRDVARRRAALL